jgi:hypothetical protein
MTVHKHYVVTVLVKSGHSEALLCLKCIHSGGVVSVFVRYTGTNRRLMKYGYENKDQMSLIQLLGHNKKLQISKEFATDRT